MSDWLQYLLAAGGAVMTGLLAIIAYFLANIHADFKDMKEQLIKQGTWIAVKESLLTLIEERLKKLEQKVFG